MELLTYEWRRAKSIRTTWITSFFVVASVAAFAWLGTVATTDIDGNPIQISLTDLIQGAVIGNPIALVLLASLGAMAFGHEYRYGTIRLTLTAFPKRTGVFFTKLFMTLLIAMLVMVLSVVAAYAVLVLLGDTAGGGLSWAGLAWQVAVYASTLAVLAFCLTVITRNHPLGIIGPVLLSILESALIAILGGRFAWLPDVLPFASLQAWFDGEEVARAAGVWAAWMLGFLIIGFVLLKRRDA